MPDYQRFTSEVDKTNMNDSEWQEVVQHQEWFQCALRGFFSKAPPHKRPALYRRATFWFLMGLSNALTRLGLARRRQLVGPRRTTLARHSCPPGPQICVAGYRKLVGPGQRRACAALRPTRLSGDLVVHFCSFQAVDRGVTGAAGPPYHLCQMSTCPSRHRRCRLMRGVVV